jgi:hypothetical protein
MTHDHHDEKLGDEELGRLAPLARALPREVAPPTDLWERIAARLEPRDRIEHLAGSLPAEIVPPADLWPAIAARIAPRPRARRFALATAASVAVAALVAVGVQLGGRHDAGSGSGTAPIVADDSTRDAASAGRNVDWIFGTPALPADVAASLSQELALVRDERLSIERAIASEPGNTDLRELWAYAYETELELADACSRTVMEFERNRG